ncbi:hypothetical protein GCM10009114_03860 [Aliiglaciecola litoralis]|uniref:histidine kinase n=2 Tax=Aliiglaciecola litoralis TaxID=582857 RepID=A0ABP3WNE7_9ALTE
MTDNEKALGLINLFTHPVIVVNKDCQLVAVNTTFEQDTELSENLDSLLTKLTPLISSQEELVYWQKGGREKCLTRMPMHDELCMIKIANSKPLALAKRYHNLVNAINQMSDAIIIIDHHFKIDLINDQFIEMFPFVTKHHQGKLSAFELIEKIANFLSPNDPVYERKIFRFLRFKLSNHHECNLAFSLPNGEFFSYRDNLTHGNERSGLCINESQFKELNEQLESAFNEATELSDAKSNFMAAMSHEVRTPLNAIIGLVDLCMLEPTLQKHEYIKRMRSSATALLHLVNDVLDFTKFDANKVQLTLVNIQLREFCEKVIDSFAGQAQSKNTALMLFVDPNLPQYVIADDVRLSQILYNLISNGLKFNNNSAPELWLHVSQDSLTGYTRFSVKDNGIGIKKSQQTSIFDRFSQANHNIHRQYGGTGIGLSLCQKICNMMEGDIYVKSQEGEGSEFIVQLPLQSSGESEISKIDFAKLANKTLITNDRTFYQVMELYSQSLKFEITYVKEVPGSLSPDAILCIDKTLIDDPAMLTHYSAEQVVLLMDALIEGACEEFRKIHRTPVRLKQILKLVQSPDPLTTSNTSQQPADDLIKVNQRVLVVEDNSDNMFVLKKQFQTLGIDASFALTPEDAVIFFEQQKFDIVISDFQMPAVSGAELLKILRETEKFEERPPALMVILTADKTKRCTEACFAAGANRIMMKPMTVDELVSLMNDNAETAKRNQQLNMENKAKKQDADLKPYYFEDTDIQSELEDEGIFYADNIGILEDATDSEQIMQIECLRSILGYTDEHEEHQYLQGFAQSLLESAKDMERAYLARDIKTLGKLVHSLKSSALIIGASQLSQQCEILETICSQSDIDMQQINTSWQQTLKNIEQLINHIGEYCSNDS